MTIYVRYRQVAEYLSTSDSHHSRRANKLALWLGIVVALGVTLTANFEVGNIDCKRIHGAEAGSSNQGLMYPWEHFTFSGVTMYNANALQLVASRRRASRCGLFLAKFVRRKRTDSISRLRSKC